MKLCDKQDGELKECPGVGILTFSRVLISQVVF